MQDHPPSDNTPAQTDLNTSAANAYFEPTYTEYARVEGAGAANPPAGGPLAASAPVSAANNQAFGAPSPDQVQMPPARPPVNAQGGFQAGGAMPPAGYIPATPPVNYPGPRQSGLLPPAAPQGYRPGASQPGYPPAPPQGYMPPPAQPTYPPRTPQPGYIPPTPQPGYVPPASQPGYPAGYQPGTSQPGYPPVAPRGYPPGYQPGTSQPGYPPVAPQGYTQSGYLPAPPQGYAPGMAPESPAPLPPGPPPRKGLDRWALASIILIVILLLGGVVTSIAVFGHRNPTATTNATPITSGTTTTPGAKGGTPPTKTTAAFKTAACPFNIGEGLTEGQQVSCGYVTVAENHETQNGKTIKLAVAIFKGQQYLHSATADPMPVLRLEGGPGGPSLDNWAKYVSAQDYNQLIFDHDVIMFDQRGTGYSTPSLKCPELIQLQYSSTDVSSTTYEASARACHDRLVGQGINLSDFNSMENAGDVSDIVHALGYKQMTLYGVSYGTRLALTTMRLYPSVISSVILDSTYPTNHTRSDLPSDAQRVFNVFFQGCAKDTKCNAEYPNLQTVFYNLVDTLNANPTTFNTVDPSTNNQYTAPLSGDDLLGWLFSALYATSFIPELPQTIFQVKAHEYTQFSALYGQLEYDSTFSDGMFYSATCSEDWAFLTEQDITKSEQGIEPHIAKVFGTGDEQQEYDVCKFWNVQAVPASQKQPVTSSLPTLILAGEYDPITPPANGQEVEKGLSHSYYFLVPGQGHGQEYSSPCSDQIVQAFEANPNQQPASGCIAQMSEPNFQ